MPTKTTVLAATATVLSVVALGVAVVAWIEAWMNQPLDEAPEAAPIEIGDIAGVVARDSDIAIDLTPFDEGGNTQVIWRCGKVLAGSRFDYAGAWTHLGGRVLIDPTTRTLRAGELHITLAAMRGHGDHPAPNAMINTVRSNQWFVPEHANAVLTAFDVKARTEGENAAFDRAIADWTHALSCKLQLNGIERDLTVYARLELGDRSLRLAAVFAISRAEFEVKKRTGFEPPTEVDDEVLLEVKIHATPDPLTVIAELNRQLVAQQAASGQLADQVATLTGRLDRIETSHAELQRELLTLSSRTTTQTSIDLASLPARFTDRVDYKNERGDKRMVDLGHVAEFEMVLIPGDPERGIGPFYAQTTEVTWNMFRDWAYCSDIEDPSYAAELQETLLRPTPCYEDASRGHGFDGRAVLGISRRNAVTFCRHVSELTGRSYRLWTDAEWRYVADATGGLPKDLHAVAWLSGNVAQDEWGEKLSMPVGKKPANSFGLHDFWGNVAEWVMSDEQYIRGGSYLVTKDDLSIDWRENESQNIWNETYPNLPKSLWWYRDRFDMGFRLVCDPVNIPEAK